MTIPRIPDYLVPLRYTGGKASVLSSLHEHLPAHFDEFRDPFLGGGSYPLSVMWRFKHVKYWLNEGNPFVFNFWKNLHKHAPNMQKWVTDKKSEFYKDGFYQLFCWCRSNIRNSDPFEQGCIWYIMNRLSYNGMGESFTGTYHFNDGKILDLKYCGELMKSVDLTITNYDFSTLLSSSTKKVFVFLDAPYELGSKTYYGKLHRRFNHDVFSLVVKESRHKWMLTYNDIPEIRKRFAVGGFNLSPLPMKYKKDGKPVIELVIKNY